TPYFCAAIMNIILLILIPFLAGIISFFIKGNGAKGLALASSLATLVVSGLVAFQSVDQPLYFNMPWIPQLGTQFSLMADGMGATLCLLTGIVMPVIIIANWNKEVERPWSFYGLMLLSQAGITGVFLAY